MQLETAIYSPFLMFNVKITNKNTTAGVVFIVLLCFNGGDGGNRTPVRKSSTDSSTYLALLFSLICAPPTDKRYADELP